MKNLVWFCIGIVTGRSGIPITWHALYATIIVVSILSNTFPWPWVVVKLQSCQPTTYYKK